MIITGMAEYISIHALREEGDRASDRRCAAFFKFLSTPSARRATGSLTPISASRSISIHALREEGDPPRRRTVLPRGDFYPRPPRGGRRRVLFSQNIDQIISIHALREEGDRGPVHCGQPDRDISIHALREEGDRFCLKVNRCDNNFYPRPPRGGRQPDTRKWRGSQSISIHALREEGDQLLYCPNCGLPIFLSTPSARRATPLEEAH